MNRTTSNTHEHSRTRASPHDRLYQTQDINFSVVTRMLQSIVHTGRIPKPGSNYISAHDRYRHGKTKRDNTYDNVPSNELNRLQSEIF